MPEQAPSLEAALLPGTGRNTLEERKTSSISKSALVQISLLLQPGLVSVPGHKQSCAGSSSPCAAGGKLRRHRHGAAKFCLLPTAAGVSLSSSLLTGSLSPDMLGSGLPSVGEN